MNECHGRLENGPGRPVGKWITTSMTKAFETNAEETLQDVLDGKSVGTSLMLLESALAISPPMRNYGAQ